MSQLRVFLGSSKEGRPYAEALQALMYEVDSKIQVFPWWMEGVFPPNVTFIEALDAVMKQTSASVLLATADDKVSVRGDTQMAPRDNIIFEAGLAMGVHGREFTAIAQADGARLPSDLLGVTTCRMTAASDVATFKERNRDGVRALLDQWKKVQTKPKEGPADLLPRLYQVIVRELENLRRKEPRYAASLDLAASAILEVVSKQCAA